MGMNRRVASLAGVAGASALILTSAIAVTAGADGGGPTKDRDDIVLRVTDDPNLSGQGGTPFPGVTVNWYCADLEDEPGEPIETDLTGPKGYASLRDVKESCGDGLIWAEVPETPDGTSFAADDEQPAIVRGNQSKPFNKVGFTDSGPFPILDGRNGTGGDNYFELRNNGDYDAFIYFVVQNKTTVIGDLIEGITATNGGDTVKATANCPGVELPDDALPGEVSVGDANAIFSGFEANLRGFEVLPQLAEDGSTIEGCFYTIEGNFDTAGLVYFDPVGSETSEAELETFCAGEDGLVGDEKSCLNFLDVDATSGTTVFELFGDFDARGFLR